jgi:DNA invertase Pin-like site-specific DNA recombinase
VEQLADARGLEVVAVYEEQASAAKRRQTYETMLRDAKRGKFSVLVIWALDRFGRSMVGNLQDVLELDRIGVTVVSVRESWLDTGGPVRSLLIAIFPGSPSKSAGGSSRGRELGSSRRGSGERRSDEGDR